MDFALKVSPIDLTNFFQSFAVEPFAMCIVLSLDQPRRQTSFYWNIFQGAGPALPWTHTWAGCEGLQKFTIEDTFLPKKINIKLTVLHPSRTMLSN